MTHQNPFQALTEEEWAEIVVWPAAAATAFNQSAHLQFLGQMGSGKTSLLLACHARLRYDLTCRAKLEYLAEGERRRRTSLDQLDVYLLDEAQRLSWRERKKWVAAAGRYSVRLIFSSHRDMTPLFKYYHLPLTTIRLDVMTPSHLQALLERRLAHFASPITFTPETITYLWKRFGPNWRDMEFFLYDVWQQWGDKTNLGVQSLQYTPHAALPLR